MFSKKLTVLTLTLCLVLGLGFSTQAQTSDAAKTDQPADWKFHSIVDVDFVMAQVKVPMPEDVMIIDARPKRAKYDKGHSLRHQHSRHPVRQIQGSAPGRQVQAAGFLLWRPAVQVEP